MLCVYLSGVTFISMSEDMFADDDPGMGPNDPLASLAQGKPGPFACARWYLEAADDGLGTDEGGNGDSVPQTEDKCFGCDMTRQGLSPPSLQRMDAMIAAGAHVMADEAIFRQMEQAFNFLSRDFVGYRCSAAMFRAHYNLHAPDPRVVVQSHLCIAQEMMSHFIANGVMNVDDKAQPPTKDAVAMFSLLVKTTNGLMASAARLRSTGTARNG